MQAVMHDAPDPPRLDVIRALVNQIVAHLRTVVPGTTSVEVVSAVMTVTRGLLASILEIDNSAHNRQACLNALEELEATVQAYAFHTSHPGTPETRH